jgi:hypothetical protein
MRDEFIFNAFKRNVLDKRSSEEKNFNPLTNDENHTNAPSQIK